MKILLNNHKKELKQIKIEEEKQSEEMKIRLQQETDNFKNDIAKSNKIFSQKSINC